MNRRGFLAGLLSIPVAVAAGDLLWVPGKKIITYPSPGFYSLADEIAAITRSAFTPKMVVQIYKTSPLYAALLGHVVSAR